MGSGIIPSIIDKSCKSVAIIFIAIAACAAREESLQRIDAAPSGEITL
ncbi:hypothetical protein FXW26_02970 [Candidatus Liberibacter asiaticus]|nr:hypothetical protein FXW26_02970 [Candidatus Liberibacter asiaticus]